MLKIVFLPPFFYIVFYLLFPLPLSMFYIVSYRRVCKWWLIPPPQSMRGFGLGAAGCCACKMSGGGATAC